MALDPVRHIMDLLEEECLQDLQRHRGLARHRKGNIQINNLLHWIRMPMAIERRKVRDIHAKGTAVLMSFTMHIMIHQVELKEVLHRIDRSLLSQKCRISTLRR